MRHIQHFLFIGTILTPLILVGCMRSKIVHDPPPCTVAISLFKSNADEVVSETVRDSLIYIFFKRTNTKVIKGTEGDIVIRGTIAIGYDNAGSRSAGLIDTSQAPGGVSVGSHAQGAYVTGITAQAYQDGEMIAVASIGHDLRNGVIRSPVSLAKHTANELISQLFHERKIGPRKSHR